MLENTQKPQKTTKPSPRIRNPFPGPDRVPHRINGTLADYSFDESVGFSGGPVQKKERAVTLWSMAATLIDVLSVMTLLCVFLLTMLVIQRFMDPAGSVSVSFMKNVGLGLYLFLHPSYLLISRFFLGCTLGEWSCDLRVGNNKQRLAKIYGIYVLKRFFVTLVSGVVVLPIFSWIFGYDLAGRISNVPLVRVGANIGRT